MYRVPVAVWQPCELLYTCYLLTYFRRGHRKTFYWASRYGRGAVILWPSDGSVLLVLWLTSCLDIHMWPATRKGRIGVPKVTQLGLRYGLENHGVARDRGGV